MTILAMNRDEVARPRERDHLSQLVLAGVPRNVNRSDRVVNDVGALPVETIDQGVDGAFVAGNEAR